MFFNLDFAYNNDVSISKIWHLPSLLANRRLFCDLDDLLVELRYAYAQRVQCNKANKLAEIDAGFRSNGTEEVVDAIVNDGSFNQSLVVELMCPANVGGRILFLYTVVDSEEDLKEFVSRIVKGL